jgi:hypothetical protein
MFIAAMLHRRNIHQEWAKPQDDRSLQALKNADCVLDLMPELHDTT